MYIDHGWLCLSLAAFPHYSTDPDFTWGMVGVPPGCALLGNLQSVHGFRCCDSSTNAKCQRVLCTRSMSGCLLSNWKAVHIPVHLTWYVHGIILFHSWRVGCAVIAWEFTYVNQMFVFIKLLSQLITHFSHDTIFVTNPVVFMLSDLISYWWHA